MATRKDLKVAVTEWIHQTTCKEALDAMGKKGVNKMANDYTNDVLDEMTAAEGIKQLLEFTVEEKLELWAGSTHIYVEWLRDQQVGAKQEKR